MGKALGAEILRCAQDDRECTKVRVGADAHIRPRAEVGFGPYGF